MPPLAIEVARHMIDRCPNRQIRQNCLPASRLRLATSLCSFGPWQSFVAAFSKWATLHGNIHSRDCQIRRSCPVQDRSLQCLIEAHLSQSCRPSEMNLSYEHLLVAVKTVKSVNSVGAVCRTTAAVRRPAYGFEGLVASSDSMFLRSLKIAFACPLANLSRQLRRI